MKRCEIKAVIQEALMRSVTQMGCFKPVALWE